MTSIAYSHQPRGSSTLVDGMKECPLNVFLFEQRKNQRWMEVEQRETFLFLRRLSRRSLDNRSQTTFNTRKEHSKSIRQRQLSLNKHGQVISLRVPAADSLWSNNRCHYYCPMTDGASHATHTSLSPSLPLP